MKNFKALMLGSAAGLAAVTAGQAADLPVKAKPVEYVKICSLYGAGFYYIPGTDTCLKIGGWVRAEAVWGANGNLDVSPLDPNVNNRTTNNLATRERGYITADARDQTAYGTARGYIAVGISSIDTGNEAATAQFSANRAFVQWAGLTGGLSESFYDFYSAPAVEYRTGYIPASDTSDAGWWVWAYTAEFGGGFSATIAAEERRDTQIIAFSGAGGALGGPTVSGVLPGSSFTTGAGYGGWQTPDYVGNIRVDTAWGSAQVMAAAHQLNATYYGPITASGHPDDAWGWAVGGGVKINLPQIGAGDYFQSQVNYTQGALRYVSFFSEGNFLKVNGATEGYGVMSDCIFGGTMSAGNATSCQLTTAWGLNAGYEHYWTPEWHQSVFGGFMVVQYDANANNMLCVAAGLGTGAGTTAAATPGCSNNWSTWGVGSRLQWDVTKSTYIGFEAAYQGLNSATTPTGMVPAVVVPTGSGATTVGNQSNWVITARLHKDFAP
jgi:Porin subfamily